MKSTIKFYIAIFMWRIHYFVLISVLATAASVSIAKLLPPVYVSSTRLLVEASQIPAQLAASTVQTAAAEELQIIEQRLMTRANLLEIARDLNVFPDIVSMTADEIVDGMKNNTFIQSSAGRGQATLMDISFEATSGRIAANVANRYVDIILEDNAEIRTDQAGKTLEFFEAAVERLGKELDQRNAEILKFNNENSDALPQTLQYRLDQYATIQTRLATTENEISLLSEQKRRLIEIFETTGTVGSAATANLTPEQQRLATLKDSLLSALAIYSPENPKVKILEAQIAQQEILVNQQAGITQAGQSPLSTVLDLQLADIDARLAILNERREFDIAQMADLEDSIERTPAVTLALATFDRDYQNTQQQYNTAVSGLSKAATGERIEILSKGQRIVVIDPATVPTFPERPNRTRIAIAGTLLGIIAGLGLIAGLEFLNSSIRRASDITRGLGITPIVTVPYIRTPMEMVMRRAAFVGILAFLVFGLPAALFAVHTYYLPLDLIYDRFADKIGGML